MVMASTCKASPIMSYWPINSLRQMAEKGQSAEQQARGSSSNSDLVT